MAIWDDIADAYNAADDWTKKHLGGPIVGTGEVSNAKKVGGGGGSSKSSGVGAGKSYDPDNMIDTYLPGLNPQQRDAVRQALRGAESGSGAEYHQALNQLVSQYPQLQQYTPMGRAFGTTPQPGQLDPTQLGQLEAATEAYQKPYIDMMKQDEGMVQTFLKQLMPSLPKGYQDLMKAQMSPDNPVGLANIDRQVQELLGRANPGMIANAYAAYNGSGATTSPTSISSLLGSLGGASGTTIKTTT